MPPKSKMKGQKTAMKIVMQKNLKGQKLDGIELQ